MKIKYLLCCGIHSSLEGGGLLKKSLNFLLPSRSAIVARGNYINPLLIGNYKGDLLQPQTLHKGNDVREQTNNKLIVWFCLESL